MVIEQTPVYEASPFIIMSLFMQRSALSRWND